MRRLSQSRVDEVVANGLLRAGYLKWAPGATCLIHSHEGAGELFVFLSGSCEVETEQERGTFNAGETVYVDSGEKHRLTAVGEDDLVMFFVVAPNISPTHTFYRLDGSAVAYDRVFPNEEGVMPPAPELPEGLTDVF